MKDVPIRRREALAGSFAVATSPWLLTACGGGSSSSGSSGTTQLRVLNVASDIGAIDFLANTTVTASSLANAALSSYSTLDAATYTLTVRNTSDQTTLLATSYAISKGISYTGVVWGRASSMRLNMLSEDAVNTDITTGNSRLRVFNATIDAGNVDVYLTTAAADIAEASALQAGLGAGTLGGYKDITQGTYRLRVTGAGDPTDLRLDVAAVTLANQVHNTLVLTAGASGVLLNGVLIPLQQGATAMSNTLARVRVVAAVDGAGTVAVTLGSTTIAGGYRSPTVGPYTQVTAGALSGTIRVNGAVVTTGTYTLAAGADYTLLVTGSTSAAIVHLLTDDNRIPTTAGRTRIRMVNGTASADPLTLSVDYLALSTDVPAGTASAYSTVASSTTARVDVTAASAVAPVYTIDGVNLVAGAVYTVFVLGGNATATGVIRRER